MNPFQEGIQVLTTALADENNNGILDIREVINGEIGGGSSDTSGIETAWNLHQALPGDPNIIFMSDGYISVDDRLISQVKADGVNLTAFGFAQWGMDAIRRIDSNASYISRPEEIVNIFSGFDTRYISEPFMEGVTVYLDLNNNGTLDNHEPSQVSRKNYSESSLDIETNYYFNFDNLLPGTYTVRQISPSGYTETFPSTGSFIDTVTIDGGETFSHFFGNHQIESAPNSRPVFTSTAPSGVLEAGEVLKYKATATDADADLLVYDLTVAPEGMSVDRESGDLIWIPGNDRIGEAKAILRVSDNRGGVDLQYFELTVTPPNTPPTFTSDPANATSPQVGKPFQYNAIAIDPDDDPITSKKLPTPWDAAAFAANTTRRDDSIEFSMPMAISWN